jgi:hypothetical protein
MSNVNGLQNENQVQQKFLLRSLGAPLLLTTYKDGGLYYGKPAKDRVQVKVMAIGLKNSGFTDVIVWELKQHDGGSKAYTYCKTVMDEIFGNKKAVQKEESGLSKAEIQSRGLSLEAFGADVHQVKINKDYSDETYQALAESFATTWREIGAPPQMADMITEFVENWDDMLADAEEESAEETEDEAELEESEV